MKYIKHYISVFSAVVAVTCFSCFSNITGLAVDFSDVSDNVEAYDAIKNVSELGIVNGYDDGTFKPDNNITKSELAAMISRMTPYDSFDDGSFDNFYDDVSEADWAYKYIGKATSCGVFSTFNNTPYDDRFLGTTSITFVNIEDKHFEPYSYVTYRDAVKAVITLLGYNGIAEKNGGYKSGYLDTAKHFGFLKGIKSYSNDEYISRGDFSVLVNNALDIHMCVIDDEGYTEQLKKENVPYITYDNYVIFAGTDFNTLRDIISK